ncbi:MAG: NADPH:quinone reductase [Subtercola sp.]|nr:NADPH:quinone reductase [Subtercola sp.]
MLVYEDAPVVEPGPGEVLVEVHAAAITFAELGWEETWKSADGRDRTPIIPSHEVSGVVSELGADVTEFRVGDEVYGRIGFDLNGAAADYATVPVGDLALRPTSVGHVESASVPLAALTAWQALVDHAEVQSGEHVIVLGASGGVGAFGVQIARHCRARVSATARGADLDFVKGLGAEVVLDYRAMSGNEGLETADVVLHTVDGPVTASELDLVRPGGRLVTLSQPISPELLEGRNVRAIFFIVEANRAELETIARLVDSGAVKPTVAQVFTLADGRRAFEEGPRLHKPGKTVLQVR